jgi:hypothetical protein
MDTDQGTSSGHDSSDYGIDPGLIAGMMVGAAMNADKAAEPRPVELYVEPDYGAIWERRWRWIRPVLMAVAAIAIVLLVAATR